MHYLDNFVSEDGYPIHPAYVLHSFMQHNHIEPADIEDEYGWNPIAFLRSGQRKVIETGETYAMGHQEAGIIAALTGIPPGIWLKAADDFYRSLE